MFDKIVAWVGVSARILDIQQRNLEPPSFDLR